MSKKILLVGGGGHCKSVLDSLLKLDLFSEIGIIDVKENIGKEIMGVPIISSDDGLKELYAKGYKYAFVTIGGIGNPSLRIKLFNQIVEIGFVIPNIIDPSANISKYVSMEIGIFVGKNAVINAETKIHKGAIINTGSIIEHDCSIDEFVHIAPGSVLNGGVNVGKNTHIGARSVVKQQVIIGSNSMIGMGSVVIKDIKDNIIAYGNPCKEVISR